MRCRLRMCEYGTLFPPEKKRLIVDGRDDLGSHPGKLPERSPECRAGKGLTSETHACGEETTVSFERRDADR